MQSKTKRVGFIHRNRLPKMQVIGCFDSRVTDAKMVNCACNIRISGLCALKVIFGVDFGEFFTNLIPRDFYEP